MRRVVTFPLSLVTSGQRVVLVSYAGNGRSNQRLAELGLTPETEIRVLQAVPGQPLVLNARGYRLAIDRKTAEKIQVRVCGEGTEFPCRRKRRGRWFGRHWRVRRRWWRGRKQQVEDPLRIIDRLRHSKDEAD